MSKILPAANSEFSDSLRRQVGTPSSQVNGEIRQGAPKHGLIVGKEKAQAGQLVSPMPKISRSELMSRVRQENTGPELLLRSMLHRAGFRYTLHSRNLPGRPDIVLPRYKTALFVHGCYWHAHGCYRSTLPRTRREYWLAKFRANRRRDLRNTELLISDHWRVLVVWECALVGKVALQETELLIRLKNWLPGNDAWLELEGIAMNPSLRPPGLTISKNE